MPDIYEVIREAIQTKRPVRAIYDGRERFICPHVLGEKLDKKTGHTRQQCLSYQYDGESSKGIFPKDSPDAHRNWRCMFIDTFESAELITGEWFSISPLTAPPSCVDKETADFVVAGWQGMNVARGA